MLGRSLPPLIETIGQLEARGGGFKSVQESVDTTIPGGRLVFHVFGAFASFESPVTEVAQVLGVSRATLYRKVPELGEARTRAVMNEPDAGVSSSPLPPASLGEGSFSSSACGHRRRGPWSPSPPGPSRRSAR